MARSVFLDLVKDEVFELRYAKWTKPCGLGARIYLHFWSRFEI